MKKILFVCYGNICRSPSAQGIFEYLIKEKGFEDKFQVDSAGTHDFHIGKLPDSRAIHSASKHNVDLTLQQARQFCEGDFEDYDEIFVMDEKNKAFLTETWPNKAHEKITEFISFDPTSTLDKVPDPFHGEPEDFDEMMILLFNLCEKSIAKLTGNQNS